MSKSMTQSSLVMFAGTLVSRVLGLVRSPLLLGAVVGINYPVANAFDIANRLPNLIYMLVIGGVVNAVLVPAIVRATKNSRDDGAAFINKLLTVAIVGLGFATLALTLAAPLIVKLFAATMSDSWFSVTVAFAFWCIPQVFFYGLYTVLGQILNARENFGPYMWAPALNNIVAIIGLLAMIVVFGSVNPESGSDPAVWDGARVALLGGSATAGIAAQALILIFPMRKLGIRFRPDFKWRGSGLGGAAKASWWMLLTMVTGIIPTALTTNVSAGATDRAISNGQNVLDVAGNAAYSTAYALYSLPTSLIVVSIATAMFTRLAKAAANRNIRAVRHTTSATLRVVGMLMVLSQVGITVLAVPLVRILAATVSMNEVVAIARVLIAMTIGLVFVGATTVLNRVYYAYEDTRGAFLIGLPFQAIGLVGFAISAFLPPQWTVVGVGITMSLANIGAFWLMYGQLTRRLGDLDAPYVIFIYLKLFGIGFITALSGFALLAMFGPVQGFMTIGGALLRCLVVGPYLVIVFFGLMWATGMSELDYLSGPLRRIWMKVRRMLPAGLRRSRKKSSVRRPTPTGPGPSGGGGRSTTTQGAARPGASRAGAAAKGATSTGAAKRPSRPTWPKPAETRQRPAVDPNARQRGQAPAAGTAGQRPDRLRSQTAGTQNDPRRSASGTGATRGTADPRRSAADARRTPSNEPRRVPTSERRVPPDPRKNPQPPRPRRAPQRSIGLDTMDFPAVQAGMPTIEFPAIDSDFGPATKQTPRRTRRSRTDGDSPETQPTPTE